MAQYLLFSDGNLRLADAATGRIVTLVSDYLPATPEASIVHDFSEIEEGQTFFRHSNTLYALDRDSGALRTVDTQASGRSLATNFRPGSSVGQDSAVTFGDGYLVATSSALFALDARFRLSQIAGNYPEVPGLLDLRDIGDLVAFRGRTFFVASHQSAVRELFVSDGTEAGTRLFRDFYPDTPRNAGAVDLDADWILGNRMVFTVDDTPTRSSYNSRSVWTTDGTEAGTILLPVATRHEHRSDMLRHDGALWFATDGRDEDPAVWRTNGTVGGSRLVADADGLVARTPYAGLPYMVREGTRNVQGGGIEIGSLSAPFEADGGLYVAALAGKAFGATQLLLFRIDRAQPELVLDTTGSDTSSGFRGFSNFRDTFAAGDLLFATSIATRTPSGITIQQRTVFAIDPVSRSTTPILELTAGEQISSIHGVQDFGDRAVLIIADRSITAGVRHKLISTDGTVAGTVELAGYDGYVVNIMRAGDYLYWWQTGNLMASDGTPEGTRLVLSASHTAADWNWSYAYHRLYGLVELEPEAFAALGPFVPRVVLEGTDGRDTLRGTDSADEIHGLGGDDRLFGLGGDDHLFGGAGNDRLDGGSGADRMEGGEGNDTYVVNNRGDRVIERASQGADTVQSAITYTLPAHVENLTLTGSAGVNGAGNGLANVIRGNAGANALNGGAGDDRLFGEAGDDRLIGGAGHDRLDGGRGADRMEGGPGNDAYVVDNRADRVIERANQGVDTVQSSITYTLPAHVENLTLTGSANINGAGNVLANVIRGNAGANALNGGTGDDRLFGGAGNDRLIGGPGNDRLEGGSGNDRMEGGAGRDTLLGGTGNDTLIGATARDILNGGAGRDTFVFRAIADSRPGAGNRDVIQDFTRGQDRIDLSAIDANAGRGGDQAFKFVGGAAFSKAAGELRYAGGIVRGDVNGDGRADFEIEIANMARLSAGDFIL